MRKPIFIDTGSFYARYVARDDRHEEAQTLWNKIKSETRVCLTTNFVLSEFLSLLVHRFGHQKALQAGREVYASQSLEIVHVSLEQELAALDWMEKYSDQQFSMTDAVSFAVMKEQNLRIVFTFDDDFSIAGFERFQ